MSDIESNLGTMVINEEEDSTMKQYGTAPGHSSYRFTTSIIICFSTMHSTYCTGSSPCTEVWRSGWDQKYNFLLI